MSLTNPELAILGRPRFLEAIKRSLDCVERRLETKVPHLRAKLNTFTDDQIAEFLMVTDLLEHYIDTEEKLAKKILKQDYIDLWMRAVRKRLKRQTPTKALR